MRNNVIWKNLLLALIIYEVSCFPNFIGNLHHQFSSTSKGERYLAEDDFRLPNSINRRAFVVAGGLLPFVTKSEPANAANLFGRKSGLYIVDTRSDISDSVRKEQVDTPVATLSSEYALLEVLPVKNTLFRSIEQNIKSLSNQLPVEKVKEKESIEKYKKAVDTLETAMKELKAKRSQLEPVFFTEDSTELAIAKGERGEVLIESLLEDMNDLVKATKSYNTTLILEKQKEALLTLGFLGELLVKEFPYRVPSTGKFSFLPRLLGRAIVTLRIKRGNSVLGDIKIVADGFSAPITAGNFVDLCMRNFYTGSPIKGVTKKFGSTSDPFSASTSMLGSFNEGFYSPLTGKLRRVPLEIIRLEKLTGSPKLSYSTQGLWASSLSDVKDGISLLPSMSGKPLLTFDTPGLIAMNHPDNFPNGGSSEFFGVQDNMLPEDKRRLLDGQYAPFGFIIQGYSVFQSLKPDDVIDSTIVDDFGKLNLIQIRSSSFTEVVQGTEAASLIF